MFAIVPAMSSIYASTGDTLGSHSPEWRPKIKSSIGVSPDTGDRKINCQARFRQYGDRLKTLFRALPTNLPRHCPSHAPCWVNSYRGQSEELPASRACRCVVTFLYVMVLSTGSGRSMMICTSHALGFRRRVRSYDVPQLRHQLHE
jgi:hypothetical protein